jgi:uncharacterized membrane protein YeaQ/YmgE (transglycosylase-associated protein family)
MHWVWLILVGALVGVLGRLIHPGRELMGFLVTMLVGIASLLVAGAVFGGVWSFVVGVAVAAVLVTIFARFTTHPAV